MTRENKLSIVIVFGLMIFVGMLVADHFSIASHREVAELGSNISTPPLASPTVLLDGPPPPSVTIKTNSVGDILHTVLEGETLRSICSAHYGDSGLTKSVAEWNNIQNADKLEIGQMISLPTRSVLIASNMSSTFEAITAQKIEVTQNEHSLAVAMNSYTVQKGDTLSEIAQKVMGSTKKTQLLIDINRDVMPDPNSIRPGMVLQYPKKTS